MKAIDIANLGVFMCFLTALVFILAPAVRIGLGK